MSQDITYLFSERLKAYRAEKNITQEKLSKLSDVPYRTIQDIEGSPPAAPTLRTLQKLANGLNVSISTLLEGL